MAKTTQPEDPAETENKGAVEPAEQGQIPEQPKDLAGVDPVKAEPVAAEPEPKPAAEDVPPVPSKEPEDQVAPEEKTTEPEPQVAALPPKAPEPERRGGFLGMVIGGALAAAAGYGVATFYPLQQSSPQNSEALTEIEAALQAQAERLAAAEARLPSLTELEARLTAVESIEPAAPAQPVDLTPIQDTLITLEQRLAAIEAMPADGSGASSAAIAAALEAMQADIDALKGEGEATAANIAAAAAEAEARLAEAEAQAAQMKAEAEETARTALQAAALGRVQAALESGAPFATALADLQGVEIPAPLSAVAEGGVPTVKALADAFPAAAREALEASRRATMGDSLTDRMSSFLETATGARSLAPREGDDPDAVLSRAEAAVQAGDLTTAMAEIQSLPAEGQAALSDWAALAQTRLDALSALADLSAAISG